MLPKYDIVVLEPQIEISGIYMAVNALPVCSAHTTLLYATRNFSGLNFYKRIVQTADAGSM